MNEDKKSQQRILKTSSIIGGASFINIIISLFKIKIVAILLGPTGIGLIGLLQNFMQVASNISAMGLGTSGTRQIAAANSQHDHRKVAVAKRSLFLGSIFLALVSGLVILIIREPLATAFLDDNSKGSWIAWLALGVALTVIAGSQRAVLNGLRHINELAKLSIYSSLFATLVGIAAIWFLQENGALFFVISVPLATFILGYFYVKKIPNIKIESIPFIELKKQWNMLLRLGFAFMIAGLAASAGQLAVRTLVKTELGFHASGLFEASWAISMTYIGFILAAMGSDYYPRLTEIIKDNSAVTKLVNEQTEIALLLSGPILIAMLTFAPWVITLLYSSEFVQASNILRWQILGDVLKIVSWPLGFVILASGAGKQYMLFETLAVIIFFGVTWACLDFFKIQATGIAFLAMYLVYLSAVYFSAARKIGFSWNKRVCIDVSLLVLSAIVIILSNSYNENLALLIGTLLITLLSIKSYKSIISIALDEPTPILKRLKLLMGKNSGKK